MEWSGDVWKSTAYGCRDKTQYSKDYDLQNTLPFFTVLDSNPHPQNRNLKSHHHGDSHNSPHTTSPNDTVVIQPTQAPPQTPTRYCLSRRSCKSPASGGSRRASIGALSPRRVDLDRFFVTWWLDWEAREVGAVGLFLCGSRNGSRWVRAVCGVMLRDADFDGRVRGCV
jgi:hypothetical protein